MGWWVPVLGIRGATSERSKLSIEFSWLQCYNRRNGDKYYSAYVNEHIS